MAGLSRLTTTATAAIVAQQRLLPLLSHATSRFYRAAVAAQPQLDYDRYSSYHDYENENEKLCDGRKWAVEDPAGSSPVRGVQWVFIGNTSAKKHVYAEMLSKVLEVPYISISTLVRQELHPRSFLYNQIADAVNRGKLVPESIIFGLLSKRLEDGYCKGETGFILDGIPRTRLQAEILDQLVDIDLVVNFKCSEGCFQKDGNFSDCTSHHDQVKSSTPGPKMSSENSEPKVSAFFTKQNKLLEDYYRSQKKLINFQVRSAPGETWKGLLAVLHLQHINAIHSSGILTMGFKNP
ncbi:hypothetical protein Ancab_035624 [Ancistrocladus abbreviatus]